jgi:peptidoglycan/xylan/chitin deacetylase (PgdA/CDA1 family)
MSRRFEPVVLCYHATSSDWNHHISVAPDVIERQIRSLLVRRYRAVRAADLVAGRGRLFHVTFDDAFRSVLDALAVLERHGVRGTVFSCTELADGGRLFPIRRRPGEENITIAESSLRTMTWDELRSVAERGHEVGSHTVSHPHLTRVSDVELARELRESRERLESELGRPCPFLAYPYGDENGRVRIAARAAGYEAAFGLPGRSRPYDPFAIPRLGIWRKDGPVRFFLKTSAARRPIGALRRWR